MTKIKQSLYRFFSFVIVTILVLPAHGNVMAQTSQQIGDQEEVVPLYPDVSWENLGNVHNTIEIKGQALVLDGTAYQASVNFSEKKNTLKFYAPEYLESYGWIFRSDKGNELLYENKKAQYLLVKNGNCLDSQNYCIYVWQSTQAQAFKLPIAPKIGPVGYNKISPANGAVIPLPNSTYHFLTWTDALLPGFPDTDEYQYCVDQTNNNLCDADNWIDRESLYSGGTEENPEFNLIAGQTYYWQVRSKNTLIYANGDASAWWSFTVSAAVVGFNKITPVNNSIINRPLSTYRLLNWGDAFLDEGDYYQYCIDTTNNNACDNDAWVNRDSLYSGGDDVAEVFDFPLVYGQTYYWQVRAVIETDPDEYTYVYADSGIWFKFTVQSILAAPMVSSIVRSVPTDSYTNAASVTYTVKFTQSVTGVDSTDFVLSTLDPVGGVTGASITSVGGSGDTYSVVVNTGAGGGGLRLDFIDNDSVQNFQSTPVGGVGTSPGITIGNFSGQVYMIRNAALVNAILPTSRNAVVGSPVTIFSSVINIGSNTATSVTLSLNPAPAGTFTYYQTNCATNVIISVANPSVDIPGGNTIACFLLSFTPSVAFAATSVHVRATATNSASTTLLTGVNTWLLRANNVSVPDIIALTTTTDFHQVPCFGQNVFAVAMTNVGVAATGDITVTANTGGVSLPISVLIQETDPGTGTVIGDHILQNVLAGQNRSVAVFVTFLGCITFDPAVNRIFIEFRDASNNIVGSTSTAISTNR
ncbi:MAG TPA: hypothetical protein DEP19_05875 [Anaerolineae bacterium]|nr:hypothetical protein [Anaerolineae bacterium]